MDLRRNDHMGRVAVLDNVEPSGVLVVLLQGPGVGSSVPSSLVAQQFKGTNKRFDGKNFGGGE